jgi:hypothetical protein
MSFFPGMSEALIAVTTPGAASAFVKSIFLILACA